MSKAADKRKVLKEKLVEIAYTKVESDGLHAVTARYLAGEAGCAVGAIYNMFDDMNQLYMEVNIQTFANLAQHVRQSLEAQTNLAPRQELIVLSLAYLDFALNNKRLWLALFEIDMNVESNVPEWYQASLASLMGIIGQTVAKLYPLKSTAELHLIVQTLFSSVHGIVLLGVEKRLSAVPHEQLREMISFLLLEFGDAT